MTGVQTCALPICISNCDKITPGMLMAALRLNIPAVFVSGGPMEAGKVVWNDTPRKVDLIDAIVESANDSVTDDALLSMERSACPTCGSCSGMFTANSMNCLTEALGLSLPGNGSTLATHADRKPNNERNLRILESIPENERTLSHLFHLWQSLRFVGRVEEGVKIAWQALKHPDIGPDEGYELLINIAQVSVNEAQPHRRLDGPGGNQIDPHSVRPGR